MASVGERLKHERETRNTTIEEMVRATGIGQSYLDALERDAIHELPGRAFGKLYIRAYAEVFTFDPQPWIDDYDREQRLVASASTEPTSPAPAGSRPVAAAIAQWKAARATAEKPEPAVADVDDVAAIEPEADASPEAPLAPPEVNPKAKRRLAPLVLVGVVAIASAIYFGMRQTDGGKSGERPPVRPVQPVPESRPAELPPPEPPPPVVVETPTPVPVRAPGPLSVTESGVGRRIVNLRLEGESDRFDQGARVCFSTRVAGGQRGEVVRHVWLYEGRIEQTITLRLGGPDWRTHSNKTLGHAGSWAVEARDEENRVLARATFSCGPPGP